MIVRHMVSKVATATQVCCLLPSVMFQHYLGCLCDLTGQVTKLIVKSQVAML